MKIKINLFKKIFLFSIFLVIFTTAFSYLLSTFLADTVYITRKKQEIIKIVGNVKKLMIDEDILEDYIEDIKNTYGIDVYLSEDTIYDSVYGIKYQKGYENITDGFHITNPPQTNITLLLYKEKISRDTFLFLSTSLSVMSSHRHEIYLLNLLTLLVSLCLSMILSRFFAKKITTNIGQLNRVAKKITQLDFSENSTLDTGDELSELGENINTMSSSLASSIENLKSFVSNASHELKTPITVISTHAQALLSGNIETEEEKKRYYKTILKESRDMNVLVQDLLTLSRLSNLDLKIEKELLSFKPLLKESIEKYEFLELQKDIEWDIDLDEISFLGSPKLFRIALNNIIQNALKYSPEESVIKIYKNELGIVVENPILLAEDKKEAVLFEPFSRGHNAYELKIEGNGLGLSIVKKIFELHNIPFGIKIQEKSFKFYFDIFMP